jgi:predicted NAD/FAD-dependent oxidoreductase
MSSENGWDVLIVGAGLSGLIAARQLVGGGAKVLVVDKGRGVGGRLATRRIGGGVFDHGAQYFTARDPHFVALVEEWRQAEALREWCTGFRLADGTLKSDGQPRLVGVSGMTGIAKLLARGLEVKTQVRIAKLSATAAGWHAVSETGEAFTARAVLLTCPAPQSVQLLTDSGVALAPEIAEALRQIAYDPCLALMALLDAPSALPEPGGVWLSGEPIWWLADNQRKGVSPAPRGALTVHAGPEFSRAHYQSPPEEVTAALLAEAKPWLGGNVVETQLHRWRYSIPTRLHPERALVARQPAPLIFAGDGFGGARVEGAALSGLAAAEALRAAL